MITEQEILDAVAPATPDPALVALHIARATATVQRELGFYLGPIITITEWYEGTRRVTYLENEPVPNTVILLEESNGPTDPYDVIPTDQYVVEGRRLLVEPTMLARSFKVTYTVGYEPASTTRPPPQEVAALVRQMVLTSLEAGGAVAAGTTSPLQSETMGDYSYTRADAASAAKALGTTWEAFLKRWRRMRL